MKISYLYNAVLPYRTAHDVYVFGNCWGLANAGAELELVCASGSEEQSKLFIHYGFPSLNEMRVIPVRALNKEHGYGLSWTGLFFLNAQRRVKAWQPDWVLFSTTNVGSRILNRRVSGVRYAYEIHELTASPKPRKKPLDPRKVRDEKIVIENADLLTVTTPMLVDVLRKAPYHYQGPLEVVPLGVSASRLPAPRCRIQGQMLEIFYVGGLQENQGVDLILQALAKTTGVRATIVGGPESRVEKLRGMAKSLGIAERVQFTGRMLSGEIGLYIQKADVFVMPSRRLVSRPDPATTKLLEYLSYGRATLVPEVPQVMLQLGQLNGGLAFYEADNADSMAGQLAMLRDNPLLCEELTKQTAVYQNAFSWETRSEKYLELLKKYSLQ